MNQPTNFRDKIYATLEAVMTYGKSVDLDRKTDNILAAVSGLAKECIGKDDSYPELPMEAGKYEGLISLSVHRNFLREEIRQRFKEKLK